VMLTFKFITLFYHKKFDAFGRFSFKLAYYLVVQNGTQYYSLLLMKKVGRQKK
jgi:hypothetical protein